MQPTFGQFLRQLRQEKGWSQGQAARAAGLGRVTLNRWEADHQKPRLQEIEALLKTLAVRPEERKRALEFLHPGLGHVNLIEGTRAQLGTATAPRPGHLLRALRLRRGISQEEVAGKLSVTTRTLRRWEASETEPTLIQIHDFCFCLGVTTEELMVLTTGQFPDIPDLENASLDELRQHAHHLFYFVKDRPGESLRELALLLIEMRVWPLAMKSLQGQSVLSDIYSFHAEILSVQQRYAESGYYANRAIELWPREYQPNTKVVMAGITSATAVVFKGVKPALKLGIETLSHWQQTAAQWPEYQAWLQSDMAEFMVGLGAVDSGLALVKKSIDVAHRSENLQELHNRELDDAKLLLAVRKPAQALRSTEIDRPGVARLHLAQFHLLGAQACLMLHKKTAAQERLQAAMRIIEERSLATLQPLALEIGQRL